MSVLRAVVVGLTIIMALLSLRASAESIQLEPSGGVYMLPVRINDTVTVPFILDSGAAEVVITEDIFSVLRRAGTINQSDFIGTGSYILAGGETVSSDRYVLHKMAVGDHIIQGVVANVVSIKGDPLLGQNFLEKLPAWTLDNAQHTLVLQDEVGTVEGPPQATAPALPPRPPPAPTKPSTQTPSDLPVKDFVIVTGNCRLQIISGAGFFPCHPAVMYMLLKNNRSTISFLEPKTGTSYTLAGAHDRQPNLENYYLSIDTVRVKVPDREEVIDRNMEGECHFTISRDAVEFHSIICDIYDRARNFGLNFYVENINHTEHKAF